jgi:hypothetical protein
MKTSRLSDPTPPSHCGRAAPARHCETLESRHHCGPADRPVRIGGRRSYSPAFYAAAKRGHGHHCAPVRSP